MKPTSNDTNVREIIPVCVIGSGYVGLVAAGCLAEIGHRVICVDNDSARIANLQAGGVPIYEKHLPQLLEKHRGRQLEFTTDLSDAVARSEAVFIAVGTPEGDDGAADLSYVDAVVTEIARAIVSYKVIIEKSTVPVYTNEWIRRVLHRNEVDRDMFDVVSNPEFLREGTAVTDFLHPDRIVVGVPSRRSEEVLRRIYKPLTSGDYYASPEAIAGNCNQESPARLLVTSPQSAEIIKHAANAFLALKISFINAVSNLAEAANADIEDIATGIGLDSRIGSAFLRAGLGYGGSCFPKDLAAFQNVVRQFGLDLRLLEETQKINDAQKEAFFKKVQSALWTLRGKKLTALGLAYKRDTDDVRGSPALDIVRRLVNCGANVTAYDLAATERAMAVLPPSANLCYASDLYEACRDADAVLILTDWKQFENLDLVRLRRLVRFPIVIDGRNLYRSQEMADHGFTYISVGRPTGNPAEHDKPPKNELLVSNQ